MRSFVLIIAEIEFLIRLRKEAKKYVNDESKCLQEIHLKFDQEQEKLEHELQELLDIEKGDTETLYMYIKINRQ
jgi:hypothetical protein